MFSTVDNRVQLIGFLGQEIEIKEYAEGKKMARMSMATHEYRKDDDGKKETVTTWHNLTAWGKTAEVMVKIFSNGQRLYVEVQFVVEPGLWRVEDEDAVREAIAANLTRVGLDAWTTVVLTTDPSQ